MLGGKAAAQTGGKVHRLLGGLDHQRAGTAEGVLHQRVAAHAPQVGNGSGKRFLDGRQRGVAAVAALVQTVAGGVQINLHGILAQGKANLVNAAGFGQRGGFMPCHQTLDDRFFDDTLAGRHAGKLAGQAGPLYREGSIGGQQFLPRNAVAAVKQFVKGGSLVGGKQQQYALGGAQIEVGGGNQLCPALKSHAPVGDLNVLSPQTLDFKV